MFKYIQSTNQNKPNCIIYNLSEPPFIWNTWIINMQPSKETVSTWVRHLLVQFWNSKTPVSLALNKETTMKNVYFHVNRKYFQQIGINISNNVEQKQNLMKTLFINSMLVLAGPIYCWLLILYFYHNRRQLHVTSRSITLFIGIINCCFQIVFFKLNHKEYAEFIIDFESFIESGMCVTEGYMEPYIKYGLGRWP